MRILTLLLFLIVLDSCSPSQKVVENNKVTEPQLISEGEIMEWGMKDTSITSFDGSANGIFGRKIIFRDLSATKSAVRLSGIVSTLVCIDREGIVSYAAIINSECTIKDKRALNSYLNAAKGYKFAPDHNAPLQQCGKLKFTINNPVNGNLR